eukprot:Em0001g179a
MTTPFQRSLQEKLEMVFLSQQERAKEYEQKMDALNTMNSQLMDNMEASRCECRSLETQLHKREVTITSLQEKLDTMTTELRNKENLLVQREKDTHLLQGDLKKQLSAALMEVERVKSQSKELEESITKASKLCGTEDQLQVTQTKLSEATAQLQLKEEEHRKLQQSCDDLNRQLSEEKASSVAMTSDLKAELNKREEKISQLEKTTASLEKEQERLKQELVLEQANVASLQAELQEVKRKGEVAVTSLEAKVVSREAEFQVHSKALQTQINEHKTHQLETKLANQVILHKEMSAMGHKSDHLEARLKVKTSTSTEILQLDEMLNEVMDEGVWEEPAEGFSWSVHYLKCWTCFLLECIDGNGSVGTRPPSCQCRAQVMEDAAVASQSVV